MGLADRFIASKVATPQDFFSDQSQSTLWSVLPLTKYECCNPPSRWPYTINMAVIRKAYRARGYCLNYIPLWRPIACATFYRAALMWWFFSNVWCLPPIVNCASRRRLDIYTLTVEDLRTMIEDCLQNYNLKLMHKYKNQVSVVSSNFRINWFSTTTKNNTRIV